MTDAATDSALRQMVEDYRAAFDRRDVDACVRFFADDAVLRFLFSSYEGRAAIEEWHQDRFAADVKLLRIENVTVDGDTVVAQAVATSRRLRLFRMDQVKGTMTFRVADGRFKEAVLSPRKGMPSHLDWHFR
jgi:ketosteroid isomerase-like protein